MDSAYFFLDPNSIVNWRTSTLIFYILIISVTYILVKISKKIYKIKILNKVFYLNIGYLLASFILISVKCFSVTGRDTRTGYYYNFLSADSLSSYNDQSVEFGFRLLNVSIHKVFGSYAAFLFIIGLLTVVPVLWLIWKYRKVIDRSSAIILYTCVFYFTGFSALRFALAASFVLISFDAFYEKKWVKAFVFLIIACSIHQTMIIMLLPMLLTFKKNNPKLFASISLVLLFVFFIISRNQISVLLSSSDRYSLYQVSESTQFGWEQIVYYIPFFGIYYLSSYESRNDRWGVLSFIFLATGFVVSNLGHIVFILGRMEYAFTPLILIVPFYIKKFINRRNDLRYLVDILVIIYCIARLLIYICQYYNLSAEMPYVSVFGWSI